MRVQKKKAIPHFVSLRDFCHTLGLYHAYASRLLALGILEPDGYLNSKPIFSADIKAIVCARAKIAVFKVKQTRTAQNLKELTHA
jgi:hypothetical protein